MPTKGTNATIHGGGFHHVALRVYDFDASMKFYIDGLGFQRHYGWGTDDRANGGKDSRAAMLDTGDGNYLEVFAGGTRKPGEPAPDGPFFHFALRTTDVVAAFERARAAGGVLTWSPKSRSAECRRARKNLPCRLRPRPGRRIGRVLLQRYAVNYQAASYLKSRDCTPRYAPCGGPFKGLHPSLGGAFKGTLYRLRHRPSDGNCLHEMGPRWNRR